MMHGGASRRGVSSRFPGATGANNIPVQTPTDFGANKPMPMEGVQDSQPTQERPNNAGDAQGTQQSSFGQIQGSQPSGQQSGAFGQKFGSQPSGQQSGGFGQNAFGSQPSGQQSGGFGQNAFGSQPSGQQSGGFGQNAFGSQPSGQQSGGFGSQKFGQNQGAPQSTGFGQKPAGFGQNQGAHQSTGFGQKPSGFGQNQGQQSGGNFGQKSGGFNQGPQQFAPKPAGQQREGGREHGYVPMIRELDAIYQEDVDSKELYSAVIQTDEEVIVTGAGGDIAYVDRWNDLKLNPKIMQNIEHSGYVHPRKIQAYTMPIVLEGRDLKAQAETGSGKSAAFLIPMIHKIAQIKETFIMTGAKNKPFALIIEPTRELALQLFEQARKLAHNTGVQVVKCYGKYDMAANGREIMEGCDIIVGTPGRLEDFVKTGTIDVSNLKFFVLDEADRLIVDPEFMNVVKYICGVSTYPKDGKVQNLFFSATFSPDVQSLADALLKKDAVFVHNKLVLAANAKVKQNFINCPSNEKKLKVCELLQEDLKAVQAKDPAATQPRTLVFVKRRADADLMALFLSDSGMRATTINGDRPQKEREKALALFRSKSTPILVATDVCARGLDIKDLDTVINMDLPDTLSTYVHRIGRTGRLRNGKATSLFDATTDSGLARELVKLLEQAGNPVPEFLKI